MFNKLVFVLKRIPPIILTYTEVMETIRITFWGLFIMLSMLSITHLLILGEFGFCYWSYSDGWHWIFNF